MEMDKSQPLDDDASAKLQAAAAAVRGRVGRLAEIDAPKRSFDVDVLMVELGPPTSESDPPPAEICRTVEAFYAPSARFALQEALADFLEPEGAVATELLHRTDLQQKFSAWPGRDAVLESAAAAQASPGRWTAAMRADELRQLEGEIATLTRECGHRGAPPGVNARRLSMQVAQSAQGDSAFRARFAVDAALAAWLASASTYADKLMLLLALDSDDLSPEAAQVVDQVVGEILASRRGREEALEGIDGLGPQLRALGELWRGDLPTDPQASSLLRRLSGFSNRLTGGQMRCGVERGVHAMLASDQRFHPPANPFEARKISAVAAEFQAADAALADLRALDQLIGGARTGALLDGRLTDLVSGENLELLLRGKAHQTRILDLFTLERAAKSEGCRTALIAAIAQHFERRDFVQRLFEMVRAVGARLKVLSELHRALQASGTPEPIKATNLRMLDDVQHTFMRTNRVLSRIVAEGAASVADVKEFMGLLADGVFIQGKSAAAVRGLLERHLRSPTFLKTFVTQETRPGERRADRFSDFFGRAQAAGLAVRLPADARILVADDEPQAREYVAMTLNDLGVRQVVQTADGRAALSAFADAPDAFDLIVCDWRMPHLSGLEVLKFVRASRPHQPFLMVTALSTLIAVEEALAHDVTAYVAKPFTPEQLEAKVVVLMNRALAEKQGVAL